ncbi:MAG: hypothetical protein ACRCZO_02465 [Cetobacterium sp.]
MLIKQLDKLEEIKNFDKTGWIEVFKYKRNEDFIGEDIYKKGILIKKDFLEKELETNDFNHLINLNPYCDSEGNYHRFGLEYAEELICNRENLITKEYELSISDEFISFHNLFRVDDKYFKVDESWNKEEVVVISSDSINIKKKYLKQYLSIKDMVLAICFEYRYYSEDETQYHENKNYHSDYENFNHYIGNCNFNLDYKSYGRIMGKKMITGMKKEDTGLWEYEKKPNYYNFIIGLDKDGKEIEHTCDPSKLGNFQFNNIKPDFLTPVFFKKEVLSKYYHNDNIEISDNLIRSLDWLLKMDNQRDNLVSVYLGDLAELPYNEQLYWRSFNIISDEGISKTSFARDFKAEWASPEALDLLFKSKYNDINKKWLDKFGWELFKELHEEDKHNFDDLRIPVNESQSEYDQQVLSLVKVLIDSLNEKEIGNFLKSYNILGVNGSISKFQEFLKLNLNNLSEEELLVNIINLRKLQSLRSTGTGHRKGSNYEKSKKDLGIDDRNYQENFKILLKNTLNFLDFLEKIL